MKYRFGCAAAVVCALPALTVFVGHVGSMQEQKNRQLFLAIRRSSVADATRAIADGADAGAVEQASRSTTNVLQSLTGLFHPPANGTSSIMAALSDTCDSELRGMLALLVAGGGKLRGVERRRHAGGPTITCRFIRSGTAADQLAVTEWLLLAGAEPNEPSGSGFTPLMDACFRHDGPMVAKLLCHGADPNLMCEPRGPTPLMIACEVPGGAKVVRLLLCYGAVPEAVMSKGVTALAIAKLKHDYDVIPILQRALAVRGAAEAN